MATAVFENVDVILKLNNGTTTSGAIRTVNLKLGGSSQKLNPTVYNTDISSARTKALTIAQAIRNILSKSVYETQEVTYNQLTN